MFFKNLNPKFCVKETKFMADFNKNYTKSVNFYCLKSYFIHE